MRVRSSEMFMRSEVPWKENVRYRSNLLININIIGIKNTLKTLSFNPKLVINGRPCLLINFLDNNSPITVFFRTVGPQTSLPQQHFPTWLAI